MEGNYKTVKHPGSDELIEKRSRFVADVVPVSTEAEALAHLDAVRKVHPQANHHVYAYILRENNTVRHSDDGEPGGTAGVPIYEVLRKEGLTDVCCVVTRYFGGILLGAGGLVRAYTKGAKDAVDAAEIKQMAMAAQVDIAVDYGLYGRLAQIFADFDARVGREDFADNVRITVFIREENADKLCEKLVDSCNGNIDVKIAQKLNYDFAQNK